ncbi:hypothetical protein LVD15_20765 [Fulvivirga maritima]|uniref:hypothetical protein n=1 Tax=Fulvivirga maritima TaxID=2904247 RepID=UPI001F469239|nr:hypothetical protein [Fulvivirga maritima]UII25715.1 hypothetical protein LVD15_20765 [Fulvivirga maritima]
MKRTFFKSFAVALAMTAALTSCSDDDDNEEVIPGGNADNGVAMWVITDPNNLSGALLTNEGMFSGQVDVASASNAIQLGAARDAGIVYNGDLYNPSSPSGDVGLQKFTYESGHLTEAGFIAVGEGRFIFEIVSDTKGYYTDSDRSTTAIQTFNPSTMQRTGEIDIAEEMEPYMSADVVRTRVGSFMLESQGKLYTQVFFYGENGNHVDDKSYVAVFDINSDEFIGFAIHDDFIWLGFERKNLHMASVADNGDVYLASVVGNVTDQAHARCVRIKAGENDFDESWKLDFNDVIGEEGSYLLSGPTVVGDKLYVRLKGDGMALDYSNNAEENIYAYEIDIETQTADRIEGIPGSGAAGYSVSGPVVSEGKVYFAVSNSDYQGYYAYDLSTGEVEEAFDLTGGIPSHLLLINP